MDWIYTGNYQQTGNPFDGNGGCMEDGFPQDCAQVVRLACVGNPRCMGDGRARGLGYILGGFKVKTWKGTSGRVAPQLPADTGGTDDQPIVINQQGDSGIWLYSTLPVAFIRQDYTPEWLKRTVLEKYGKKFDECLQQGIKKYLEKKSAKERKEIINRLNNLKPFKLEDVIIDPSLTAEQAVAKYKPHTKSNDGYTPAKPELTGAIPDVSRNAVIIPKERFEDKSNWTPWVVDPAGRTNVETAVIHEGGNLASYYLFGDFFAFGDPKAWDQDSGWGIEFCVFGPIKIQSAPVQQ